MNKQYISIEDFKRQIGDRPPRMSITRSIGYYKNQAILRMLQDQTLLKLLYYTTADATSLPDLTEEQILTVLNNKIYPFTVSEEIIETQKTIITMEFTIIEPLRRRVDYIEGFFTFYIQCNKDIMRIHEGVRKDAIVDRMDIIFNGAKGIGMGELRVQSLVPFWHQRNEWGGYEYTLRIGDFR